MHVPSRPLDLYSPPAAFPTMRPPPDLSTAFTPEAIASILALLNVRDLLRCERLSRFFSQLISDHRQRLRKLRRPIRLHFGDYTITLSPEVAQGPIVSFNFRRAGNEPLDIVDSVSDVRTVNTNLHRFQALEYSMQRIALNFEFVTGTFLGLRLGDFHRLIPLVQSVRCLTLSVPRIPAAFFEIDFVSRLISFTLNVQTQARGFVELEDRILFDLRRLTYIHIRYETAITVVGLRAVVEQWRNGEREIERFLLGIRKTAVTREPQTMLRELHDCVHCDGDTHVVVNAESTRMLSVDVDNIHVDQPYLFVSLQLYQPRQ